MNHHESADWRIIAHDEYEKRKHVELELARINSALSTLKQTLTTSTNYTTILEAKLGHLETTCAEQNSKLQRSVELLKNAKLILDKRKDEVTTLTNENINLKNQLAQESAMLAAHTDLTGDYDEKISELINANVTLKEEITKISAQLAAEVAQHEKTNNKLAQALAKAAASAVTMAHMPAIESAAREIVITSPDVIYAEGPVATPPITTKQKFKRKPFVQKLFDLYNDQVSVEIDPEQPTQKAESEFEPQMIYVDNQHNK